MHITAILGESVVFNCHVEFPGEHPVPYVLQWEKKVGDAVRYRTIPSALYIRELNTWAPLDARHRYSPRSAITAVASLASSLLSLRLSSISLSLSLSSSSLFLSRLLHPFRHCRNFVETFFLSFFFYFPSRINVERKRRRSGVAALSRGAR